MNTKKSYQLGVVMYVFFLTFWFLSPPLARAEWYLNKQGKLLFKQDTRVLGATVNASQNDNDDDLALCTGIWYYSEHSCKEVCNDPCVRCSWYGASKAYMCKVTSIEPIITSAPTNTPVPAQTVLLSPANPPTLTPTAPPPTPTPSALQPQQLPTPTPTTTITQEELKELEEDTDVTPPPAPPSAVINFANMNDTLDIVKQETTGQTTNLGIQKEFIIETKPIPTPTQPVSSVTSKPSLPVSPSISLQESIVREEKKRIEYQKYLDTDFVNSLRENNEIPLIVSAKQGGLLSFSKGPITALTKLPLSVGVGTNTVYIVTKSGYKRMQALPDRVLADLFAGKTITQIDASAPLLLVSQSGIPVYRIKGQKKARLLWLLPLTIDKKVTVSAENGKLYEQQEMTPINRILDKISF